MLKIIVLEKIGLTLSTINDLAIDVRFEAKKEDDLFLAAAKCLTWNTKVILFFHSIKYCVFEKKKKKYSILCINYVNCYLFG